MFSLSCQNIYGSNCDKLGCLVPPILCSAFHMLSSLYSPFTRGYPHQVYSCYFLVGSYICETVKVYYQNLFRILIHCVISFKTNCLIRLKWCVSWSIILRVFYLCQFHGKYIPDSCRVLGWHESLLVPLKLYDYGKILWKWIWRFWLKIG